MPSAKDKIKWSTCSFAVFAMCRWSSTSCCKNLSLKSRRLTPDLKWHEIYKVNLQSQPSQLSFNSHSALLHNLPLVKDKWEIHWVPSRSVNTSMLSQSLVKKIWIDIRNGWSVCYKNASDEQENWHFDKHSPLFCINCLKFPQDLVHVYSPEKKVKIKRQHCALDKCNTHLKAKTSSKLCPNRMTLVEATVV